MIIIGYFAHYIRFHYKKLQKDLKYVHKKSEYFESTMSCILRRYVILYRLIAHLNVTFISQYIFIFAIFQFPCNIYTVSFITMRKNLLINQAMICGLTALQLWATMLLLASILTINNSMTKTSKFLVPILHKNIRVTNLKMFKLKKKILRFSDASQTMKGITFGSIYSITTTDITDVWVLIYFC